MTKPEAYRVQLSRAIFRASLGVMRMCLWLGCETLGPKMFFFLRISQGCIAEAYGIGTGQNAFL